MISQKQAGDLVRDYIRDQAARDIDVGVLDERTLETDFGWVFFWNSTLYAKTGDFRYALAGNAPIIVNRFTGNLYVTSSALTIEENLANYRATLKKQ